MNDIYTLYPWLSLNSVTGGGIHCGDNITFVVPDMNTHDLLLDYFKKTECLSLSVKSYSISSKTGEINTHSMRTTKIGKPSKKEWASVAICVGSSPTDIDVIDSTVIFNVYRSKFLDFDTYFFETTKNRWGAVGYVGKLILEDKPKMSLIDALAVFAAGKNNDKVYFEAREIIQEHAEKVVEKHK